MNDPRPYWQRHRYTVQGWINHRTSVQAWKKRNPERHNAHCRKARLVLKGKYGKATRAITKRSLSGLRSGMKLRAYEVVLRAVEAGAKYGVQRAYKHSDKPDRETIEDQVVAAVMLELHEIIDFENE